MALESQRTLRVTGRELRACRARLVCAHRCGLHRPAETSGDHGERAGSAASASDASRCGGPSTERGGGRHDGCSAARLVGSTARSSIATRQAHGRPRRRRPNDRSCLNCITHRVIVSIASRSFERSHDERGLHAGYRLSRFSRSSRPIDSRFALIPSANDLNRSSIPSATTSKCRRVSCAARSTYSREPQSVLSYERESDVWTLALARARADWQHRGMSGRNRHVLTAGVTDFSLRRLPKSTTVDRPKGKTP